MRPLAATWILGGCLPAIGALEYLWHHNLTAPYSWLCLLGAALIVGAVVWTAALARKFGSPLALVGLPVFFVGFLTLFFGIGVLGVLGGFGLYALGLYQTEVVDRRALIYAAVLLALALPAALGAHSSLVGIEVAVSSACVIGVGALRAKPRHHHRRSQPND